MKQGMSLQELAAEVERSAETKKDLITDTRNVRMVVSNPESEMIDPEIVGDNEVIHSLEVDGFGRYGIRETAHKQMAGRLGIPVKYYQKMQNEAPELLANNVNHWFRHEPKERMFRMMDGTNRAILSNRYRVLDNDEVLRSILPAIAPLGVRPMSTAVTENKMYLKFTFPKVQAEVRKGDVVQAGFSIQNSEIGMGSLAVLPFVLRLWCTNGATFNDLGMRKYHVGRQSGGEGVLEFLKDDTLKADDEAFLLKLRDAVTAASEDAFFGKMVDRMRDSADRQIEAGKAMDTVEVVQKKFSLTDSETAMAIESLMGSGDLTQYGVANAITDMSKSVESYDRASDLERLGGRIFELDGKGWNQIAKAA